MIKSIKKMFMAAVAFLAIGALSSCEKDDVDEFGSAQLKVVNASPESGTQNFYLLGNVLKEGLGYGDYSSFISTNSGNRLSASFKNQNNGAEYADGELWMSNNKQYTVYLVGSGSDARLKQFEDDLSSPASGKAKIKFIHLSDGAPSDLRIKDASGDILINNISRNIESGYKSINAGTFSFSVSNTGTGNLVGNFQLDSFEAGKVYTIYFAGESSSTIQARKVEY